jgi:Asp-tRNA(Asn)/Glu-tRNA(Gln) amidotransferase C subunit
MATEKQVHKALAKLDPATDLHWTEDGLPALDMVSKLAKATVTREELTAMAPTFTRIHPSLEPVAKVEATEQAPTDGAGANGEPAEPDTQLDEDEGQAQDKPAPVTDPSTDELTELNTTIATYEQEMAIRQASVDEIKRELDKFIGQRDRLIEAREKRGDVHTNTYAIRDYLESQKRLRASKVTAGKAVAQAMAEAGVSNGGKSALDAAMSRKTARGTARPQLPFQRPSEG